MTQKTTRRRIFNRALTPDELDRHTRLKMARPRGQLVQGRRDWYRIQNYVQGSDTASVYVYDEIGYWGVSASDFVRDLQGISAANIELHLNSPGGEVFDGIAIYNALRDHPANITVYVDGLAASAASFIAMAGDTVKIARNAQIMIHDAITVVIGNAADLVREAEMLDKVSDNIADIYAQRAGGTVKQWRKAMQAETWYSAEEAVAAGLADEVHETEDREVKNSWDLSIFSYQGREAAPAPRVASVPAARATEPAPTPAPPAEPEAPPAAEEVEEPEPEPEREPEFVFDPDQFRTAVTAAADPMPNFDPDQFRDLMGGLASNAPVPRDPAAPTQPEVVAQAPAAPEPPQPAHEVVADYFRTVMQDVANHAPEPPQREPEPPAPTEPDFSIDRTQFERALREARL